MKRFDELTEDQQQGIIDSYDLTDIYCCTRVWAAWSYGTMTEDDFILASEDDNIPVDIARDVYNHIVDNFEKLNKDK
jgi:hypothetical protein